MALKGRQTRQVLSSTFLTLLALAIVYAVGMTFTSVELERLIERTVTPRIAASPGVEDMNRAILSDVGGFMRANHVRLIGYGCAAVAILLAIVGLVAERRGLASLGSAGFTLSIYAYFVIHMSFLAGLQVLKALWVPFWGNLVKLGDIAYLPYMILVYPFSLIGIDVREDLAHLLENLGLLVFVLGVLAWFYARLQRKGTADFWIYRLTRHPQYLGWIVWSYGLMLKASLRSDIPLGHTNPGASLPWVVSTLILVCIALSEEVRMAREHGAEYEAYRGKAPFLLPLPRAVARVISAPLRLLLKRDRPQARWDLVWTLLIYAGAVLLLSIPFVIWAWPPGGWATWPAA
jgi:protein-S-isoprenylcysteine O-methyltransferase Ste14